jgi:hypothetical protein
MKVKTKTLSLHYEQEEDRMKLIINKDDIERIDFWITRRFYFSILFKLETFLEQIDVPRVKIARNSAKKGSSSPEKTSSSDSQKKAEALERPTSMKSAIPIEYLLKNMNIRYTKTSNSFVFYFISDHIEAETIFNMDQFQSFYPMLKNRFPKREWGSYM